VEVPVDRVRRDLHGASLELVVDDIADQRDIDVVVNAANAQLRTGGGVAGALHRAAGRGLAEECAPLAPIEPGTCVITGAHELPNVAVIHCLGPVWGYDEPSDELLSRCYERALVLADERGLTSIAFPAISTGAYGFPMDQAARIALQTVRATLPTMGAIRLVRFVLRSEADLAVHREALDLIAPAPGT
jgi:O-acetyl-ADP-ribose deacetylase